ncbi:MAG: inositol-3-phosphate synthase [Planctomycetota bacterium]|nr:inositol-3-phosphate synthase [Planctomycetota bacterium]
MTSKPNQSQSPSSSQSQKTGLWLIGSRGAISTTLAYGLAAMQSGKVPPTGIITASPAFQGLDWAGWESWVLGGHDVCLRPIQDSARELVRASIMPHEWLEELDGEAQAFDGRMRPGILDGDGAPFAGADPRSAELGGLSPREQISALQKDWDEFEDEAGLTRTVVAYVASTEAVREPQSAWSSLAALEAALDQGVDQPASLIYAYAAISSGRPFVNFTPSLGSQPQALCELAEQKAVPQCGNDGKTGETLLKTALAPMFHARALKVLSWQGYNMLGNRDGEILKEEAHKAAKLTNKDEALRSILEQDVPAQDRDLHSHVAIDFVPSLGDWKTAWDFVHFEGFMGTRMSLQFTWAGSDSALAAPLVLDLARLAEFAARRGESGLMPHTACFFKAPLSGGTHDFHIQYRELLEYVERSQ